MVRKRPKLETESDWSLLRRNWLLAGAFLLQCVACFSVSMFVELYDDGAGALTPLLVCLGFIGAQFVMLGFVFSMLPASLMIRLSILMGGAILSICLVICGAVVFQCQELQEVSFVAGWVPMLLVGASVPFLAARAFFGWSLKLGDDLESDSRITVSALMTGTGLFAFSLTMLMTGQKSQVSLALATAVIVAGAGMMLFVPLTVLLFKCQRGSRKFLTLLGVTLLPLGVSAVLATVLKQHSELILAFSVVSSSLLLAYGVFVVGVKNLELFLGVGEPSLSQRQA
ncbi:MAG: hypothetical protein AB8B55_19845 [Mariniblastus sp.]